MSDLSSRIRQTLTDRRRQLDETEALAKRAANQEWWTLYDEPIVWNLSREVHLSDLGEARHIAHNDPASVLAWVVRERAMLDGLEKIAELHDTFPYPGSRECRSCNDGDFDSTRFPCPTLLVVSAALGLSGKETQDG